METVSEKNKFDDIIKSNNLVFVKFFATWCNPCKMMAPIVSKLSENFGNKFKFIQIDIENCENLCRIYSISSVPTFVVFKNGEEYDRISGATNYQNLEYFIKSIK